MIREEMREILAGKGLSVSRSYSLCTSEKLLRCVDGDVVTVAVGGDEKREIQLHAVVDSVHWHLQTKGDCGKLKLILGKRADAKEMDEVLHVSVTMIKNLQIPLDVRLEIDFLPCELEEVFDDSTYTANEKNWVELINNSQEQKLPELADRLTELVNDRSFKWYRNVTGGCWSGRITQNAPPEMRREIDEMVLSVLAGEVAGDKMFIPLDRAADAMAMSEEEAEPIMRELEAECLYPGWESKPDCGKQKH